MSVLTLHYIQTPRWVSTTSKRDKRRHSGMSDGSLSSGGLLPPSSRASPGLSDEDQHQETDQALVSDADFDVGPINLTLSEDEGASIAKRLSEKVRLAILHV